MTQERSLPRRPAAESIEILIEASEIAAGHALELNELLKALGALVRKVVQYQLFAVLLKDEDEDVLRIRHSIGFSEELVRNLRVRLGDGITGAAAGERRTVVVNDVTRDPRYLMAVDVVRSEIAVPLVARGKLVGVIDIQSTQKDAFGDFERNILELIGSRFSLAIDAAQLHRHTVRQNRTLRTLAEIAQEFSHILHLGELLDKISALVRELIPYDAFSIYLIEPDGKCLKNHYARRFDERMQWQSLPLGTGIIGSAAAAAEPLMVADTEKDPRYIAAVDGIRSEVAIPLILKDRVIGVLDLESEAVEAFTQEHLATLSLLAPQVAAAVENARLYEEVEQNERRLEQDLSAARELQQHLLPAVCPSSERMELAARNDPALEVSGDFYDFYRPGPGRFGILSGDVSGKGAAAAIYAALAIGLTRNVISSCASPACLLAAVNSVLIDRKIEARFLAAVYVEWLPEERKLIFANGGHPLPLLCRHGRIEKVRVSGVPLGLFEESRFEEASLTVEPGDVIMIASDGITEEEDLQGRAYGDTALPEFLAAHAHLPAQVILEGIFQDLETFTQSRRLMDDRTLIVLKAGE